MEGGLSTIYLRYFDPEARVVPLFGPQSEASYHLDAGAFVAKGRFEAVHYEVRLELSSEALAWFWHVTLKNVGEDDLSVDLILTQDIALAPYGAIRLNEYYVSQYLDHTALEHHQRGTVVATRQNLAMGARNPWCLIGSLGRGVSYATDALQIVGVGRPDGVAKGLLEGLPGCRLQHEHAMVSIQDTPISLKAGETAHAGFFGWLEEHHPEATSPSDLMFVDRALGLLHDRPLLALQEVEIGSSPSRSLFVTAPALSAASLEEAELDRWFGVERREVEVDQGAILSFFYGHNRHVVLQAKDEKVLRPHGHIIRTGGLFTPDEAVLTSTVWMDGVFHSMVTQGHVSINRFL
jgi:cellobiose phosphorylase